MGTSLPELRLFCWRTMVRAKPFFRLCSFFVTTLVSFNGTCEFSQGKVCPNPVDEPCSVGVCDLVNGTCTTRPKCQAPTECLSISCQLGVCSGLTPLVNKSCKRKKVVVSRHWLTKETNFRYWKSLLRSARVLRYWYVRAD